MAGIDRVRFTEIHCKPGCSVPRVIAAAALTTTVEGVIVLLAIITFFVTASDSGSLAIDIITAGGKTDPPVAQRTWLESR